MLHGCTQDPDDFARGTGMNRLALAEGLLVLYPEQARKANTSGCWNWFKHNHQRRGHGSLPLCYHSFIMVLFRLCPAQAGYVVFGVEISS